MNKQIEKFWIVWCDDGGVPTRKHATEQIAKEEAARLARSCRTKTFHVLELIASCEVVDVVWTVQPQPLSDIPF